MIVKDVKNRWIILQNLNHFLLHKQNSEFESTDLNLTI